MKSESKAPASTCVGFRFRVESRLNRIGRASQSN